MPKLSVEKWEAEHRKHVKEYINEIDALYQQATDELVSLGMTYAYDPTSGRIFTFSSEKLRGKAATEVTAMFSRRLRSIIFSGITTEWAFANEKTDSWVKKLFSKPKEGYMLHNIEAMEAYQRRRIYGHTLSDRVWDYSKQHQEQIELALSVGLTEGRSATAISRDVRHLLKDPDKLFRRVRDQFGNLQLSQAAQAYHPGQGVYRSSYQNAIRLARTEINGAYREADHTRWNQLDFIVGVEVKTSKSHKAWLDKDWVPRFKKSTIIPEEICDTMAGRYPKDFKFIGWHPNCRCYAVPILSNEGVEGADWWENPQNEVTTTPKKYKDWIADNKDRIENAQKHGKLPYFLSENRRYLNIRPERTEAQKQAIISKWQARQEKYKKATTLAANILNVAKNYPEVDASRLQELYDNYRINKMRTEATRVANLILAAKQDDMFLSKYIPDVRDWKKQFTSAELHDVYDAVEKKIASWSSLSLEKQAEKLKFEWDDFLGGNMKNVQLKYKTWQVSQAAYKRKYEQVLDSIDWQNIDNVLQEALTFKTKSKPYLDLIDELQVSISVGDKTKAQSIVADMQAKRAALKRAADARAVKRYGKSADGLYAGGNPFEAGELAKLKDYETRIIDGIMSGRGADHNLIAQYHDYVLQLSEKYYPKQASLFTDEERNAMKAIADKYLARPKTNPHWIWGTDLGGVYSGIDSKVNAYLPKLAGLTREEISIVQRFTNGSTFSNCYNLRNESEYWRNKFKDKLSRLSRAEIKEQYEIIEEWSQGANYTLDRMVRYNGITFRGLDSGGGPELRKALSQAFKKNKPWVNNASCSTSMKHRVAESFDGDTILIIHNKTGAYIHAISDYSSEYEIMTLRGTKYKVLAPPKRIGSRYYVELEEII